MFRSASALILILAASSAFAQRTDPDPLWQFWVKGQVQHYANFFQRAEGQAQDDVQALYGEAGASVALSRTAPLRAYGNVNVMQFSESDLSTSPGIRLGLRLDGRPHAFDVRAEQLIGGEQVVGTAAVVPHGAPGEWEIAKLAVEPTERGRGLGRQLVERCIAFAASHGAIRMTLVSNHQLAGAIRIYEALGFEHRPIPPTEYLTADVYMELDLVKG